jgi:hypothetical protein
VLLEDALAGGSAYVLPARRLAEKGLDAWAQVLGLGFEGYVAKDQLSPYRGGVTRSWLKVKVPGWIRRISLDAYVSCLKRLVRLSVLTLGSQSSSIACEASLPRWPSPTTSCRGRRRRPSRLPDGHASAPTGCRPTSAGPGNASRPRRPSCPRTCWIRSSGSAERATDPQVRAGGTTC